MPSAARASLGVIGALIYATAGGLMGSNNAGWFWPGATNDMMPWLGVGAGLVVVAFWSSSFSSDLWRTGGAGRAGQILVVLGSLGYIVSWIIEFAIIGTLTFGAGLVCLSVAVVRRKLCSPVDRSLIVLSAIGSLTWNTETVSAFLLVGVGMIWAVLSVRLLRSEHRPSIRPAV